MTWNTWKISILMLGFPPITVCLCSSVCCSRPTEWLFFFILRRSEGWCRGATNKEWRWPFQSCLQLKGVLLHGPYHTESCWEWVNFITAMQSVVTSQLLALIHQTLVLVFFFTCSLILWASRQDSRVMNGPKDLETIKELYAKEKQNGLNLHGDVIW